MKNPALPTIIVSILLSFFVTSCSKTDETAVVMPVAVSLNEVSVERSVDGEPFVLVATVFPSNSSFKEILWSSSDEKVATVNENGRVYPHNEGEAVISAKVKSTTVKGVCVVNVHL